MKMGYKRLSVQQITFIAVVAFLTLCYGIYHLTHQGTRSGTLELISFVLLMLSLFLPDKMQRSYHRLSPLQVALIGIVALFALYFGIYHLTTPDGKRSGVLELTSFTLLALTVFLPSKLTEQSQKG